MTTKNLNYMTNYYNNMTKTNQRKLQTENQEVKNTFAEKVLGSKTSAIGEISTKDMTMEEYKTYISEKISQIPIHPSRRLEYISLTISDAGFEAMKNDPEYESWVLNDLRAGWSQPNAWVEMCGGAFGTIHYGATKEEYRGSMWFPGYQNGKGEGIYKEKSQNSFWERRVERNKQIEKQYEDENKKFNVLTYIYNIS